ncbi:MAG TPA: M48 family metalloprotease [Gammaproteobacteria bacterium]
MPHIFIKPAAGLLLVLLACAALFPRPASASNLPDIGNSSELLLSPEDERRLGREFMRQVRAALKLQDDMFSNEYLQALGEKLASQVDTRDQTFTFFIVDDPTINAFAGPARYPSGSIGVHTGLILAVRNEGELSSVIAHEIAHVLQQHYLRTLSASQNLSMATIGAMIAAILLGSQAGGQAGEAVIASTLGGAYQQQLSYSRAHEQEADRVGIEMLASAGYNPNDMANFFETLLKASKFSQHSIPEFLLTHPVTSSRIADTRGRAASYLLAPAKRPPDEQPTAFDLVKTRLTVLSTKDEQQKSLIIEFEKTHKQNEKVNPLQRYEMALRYHQQRNYSKAKQLLRSLLDAEPQRLAYILASAENEIDAKNYREAIALLQSAILIYPDNLALTTLYAEASLFNGDASTAIHILENQIRSGRYKPETFKLLANAAQKAGRNSEAYEALGNYYKALGEFNTAINHFEEALKETGNNQFRELRLKAVIKQIKGELASYRTTQ